MIAKDSTGYPCLAVIQHYHVAERAHAYVYEIGRRLMEAWIEGDIRKINHVMGLEEVAVLGLDGADRLYHNYRAAAEEHKWGPYFK